ncbi:hypothetical protein ON058_00055 [Demequina sp. B12]|uniref:hypothetical protein n=1 Tax=Demequina sp. B12 TaxID=2992757 RepID=UPI00237BB132|nr:hypothetical protein [Demequina sp. B12]MDE0571807.1 hypothetical protein [Demequina sp. B12]
MSLSWNDVAAVVARWTVTMRSELESLAIDAGQVVAAVRRRWDTDPEFKAALIREGLKGLTFVIVRGPRATILYVASAAIGLVALLISTLSDDEGFVPAF